MTTALIVLRPEDNEKPLRHDLSVTMEITQATRHSFPLVAGYNWYLLKTFTRQHGRDASIKIAGNGEDNLDSLKSGKIDILVLPLSDTLKNDPSYLTLSADSTALWVMDPTDIQEARHLVQWLSILRDCPDYKMIRSRYLDFYHPSKHAGQDFISPYDDLVKTYADSLGWDWRLLSAVIFDESHFKIEAQSRRGATGLMQVMPKVASHYGHDDLLDPEQNIQAGVDILRTIKRKYKVWGTDEEQLKYVLSIFNAGPVRVMNCVEHAIAEGVDPALWDNVADLIPQDPLDTTQRKLCLSQETVAYVRHILYLYNRYCTIFPEE